MPRKTLLLLLFLAGILALPAWSQLRFYESTFNGGVVGGGYAIGSGVPSGSGSFDVAIPAGSTIRKAYLFGGRCGNAPGLTVSLNGQGLRFDNSNVVTTGFFTIYGGVSAVHAIDVTGLINPATSHYTISVPNQNLMIDKYADFYLYIAFQNPVYPQVTAAVYLNTTDLAQDAYSWTLTTSAGINTSSHVGLAIFGGYAEADNGDCEQITVAGVPLGSFGGQDYNGASAWGVMAGFQYLNNTLTGYRDDNADSAIDSTDALANIQGLIPNGSTSIPVDFAHCTPTMDDNHVWALFLTHGSGLPLAERQIDLQAMVQPSSVRLHWSIADPQGIRNYEIQRSPDGQVFQTVHTQDAGPGHSFDWEDAAAPIGQSWYRVRALDLDGGESFSDVELVELDAHVLASGLSPNPVGNRSVLHVQLREDQALDWTLYQPASGSQVLSGQHSAGLQLDLPTASLAAGTYALQLRSKERQQVLRFVVN